MFARRCATVRRRSQPSASVHARSPWPCLWPMVSSAKGVIFGVFQLRVASRVAGVALCDIPTCFRRVKKKVLCGKRNTFAMFWEDALHFPCQAQHFGHLRCHFAWQAQNLRRVLLRAFANRIVSVARSGDKVRIPWQEWHFVTCRENRRRPRTKRRF